MKLTKTLRITAKGSKKSCEEVFKMIESLCDVEVEDISVQRTMRIPDITATPANAIADEQESSVFCVKIVSPQTFEGYALKHRMCNEQLCIRGIDNVVDQRTGIIYIR